MKMYLKLKFKQMKLIIKQDGHNTRLKTQKAMALMINTIVVVKLKMIFLKSLELK